MPTGGVVARLRTDLVSWHTLYSGESRCQSLYYFQFMGNPISCAARLGVVSSSFPLTAERYLTTDLLSKSWI